MKLPPLPPPPPPRRLRNIQRLRSIAIVGGSAGGGLLFVRALAAGAAHEPGDWPWSLVFSAAYVHMAMAAVGLLVINLVDPGVARRSEATCLPLPADVAERLLVAPGQPLDGLENVSDADGRGSYCVRCCVWRPPLSHHCSICQMCVREWDHHCEIFGRCAGGASLQCRGNLLVFRVNVVNLAGAVTTASCALALWVGQVFGRWGVLFVLVPASAVGLGALRRNRDALSNLFFGYARRRQQRRKVLVPVPEEPAVGATQSMWPQMVEDWVGELPEAEKPSPQRNGASASSSGDRNMQQITARQRNPGNTALLDSIV